MDSISQRFAQPRNLLYHPLLFLIINYLDDREVCHITQVNSRCNNLISNLLTKCSDAFSIVFRFYHPIQNYPLSLFEFHNSPQKACEDILRSRVRSLFNQTLTIPEEAVKETIAKLIDKNIFILATDEDYTENLLALFKGMKKEDIPGKYEVYSRIFKEFTILYEEHRVNEAQAAEIESENLKLYQNLPKESTLEVKALGSVGFNFLLLQARYLNDDTDLFDEDLDDVDF